LAFRPSFGDGGLFSSPREVIGTTLEIESYFGDCVLSGPELSREELEAQLAQTQLNLKKGMYL